MAEANCQGQRHFHYKRNFAHFSLFNNYRTAKHGHGRIKQQGLDRRGAMRWE
jgi:hypothetical protein